jgi:hypothetical protein
MPEVNKIIDILQSEHSFGRVIREIQVNFRCSEIANVVWHLARKLQLWWLEVQIHTGDDKCCVYLFIRLFSI